MLSRKIRALVFVLAAALSTLSGSLAPLAQADSTGPAFQAPSDPGAGLALAAIDVDGAAQDCGECHDKKPPKASPDLILLNGAPAVGREGVRPFPSGATALAAAAPLIPVRRIGVWPDTPLGVTEQGK
jgi:hypothetical protein